MRRYWTLPMENGTSYWVVIAESLHNPWRAVVVGDRFGSEKEARRYILEVSARQADDADLEIEVS
jgi:hypothetical protein